MDLRNLTEEGLTSGAVEAIDLAHVDPFRIASVEVEPASRAVRSGSGEAEVQPRVMQVLVALARANGAVLSRDDLIMQCWGGRVVGDNAIHRAISRIREIASELADGSFEVVTVKGVGYRLRCDGAFGAERNRADIGLSRRGLLISAGISSAAIALAAWGAWPSARVSGLARDYYSHAEALIRSSTSGDRNDQALRQYRAAVEQSPGFAQAWSGLAFAYVRRMGEAQDAEVDSVGANAADAARRALAIDSDNARAKAALALIEPWFGRWDAVRSRLEQIGAGRDKQWEIPFTVASLYRGTGNYAEAIPIYEALHRDDPSNLPVNRALIGGYWRSGRFRELEAMLSAAAIQWPRDHQIWTASFNYLVTTGRYERARLLLQDRPRFPSDLSPKGLPLRAAVLEAVATGGEKERDSAVDLVMTFMGESPRTNLSIVSVLALLRAEARMLEVLEGYYFGTGVYSRKLARLSRRATGVLYTPYFDLVRPFPDFRAFVDRLGLRPDPII